MVFAASHLTIGFFSVNAIQQTTSRLTWALARDSTFVYSPVVARIHPQLQVLVWALDANFAIIFLAGCLYFSINGKTDYFKHITR